MLTPNDQAAFDEIIKHNRFDVKHQPVLMSHWATAAILIGAMAVLLVLVTVGGNA